MKSFAYGLVASTLVIGAALAQTTAPATSPGTSPMAAPAAGAMGTAPTATGMGSTTGTAMGTPSGTTRSGMVPGTTGMAAPGSRAAASGNDNQAVATTAADAATPAHGANSFTMGEARRRITAKGYTDVANLKKDSGGVWRGTAQKSGSPAHVWLDYKGNIGQQAS